VVTVFLKLLTAHLIADFILQTDRMVADKGSIPTSLRHALIHFLAYTVVLIPLSVHVGVLVILAMCAAIHATLDVLKARLTGDGWRPFLFDQALHIITLAGFAAGLANAGRFIGLLERGMILTFLLADSMEAVGLLLTAKALARYPEFKEGRSEFADYFLIGTLTSVGVAMVAGFAIRWAFRHLM